MPALRYLGHSAVEVSHDDIRVVIDPFLTGNDLAAVDPDELEPTAIILSHGHNDHVGDTVPIAKRAGSLVVSTFEIAEWLQGKALDAHPMSIGGAYQFPWGWVKFSQAWHSSSYTEDDGTVVPLGNPAGILLKVGESVLYHAGDTALFSDMALYARHNIDLALLPIGDNFTMGPDDALEAVRLLKPKTVVPIHYNTFDVIQQDPHAWRERVEAETDAKCLVLEPGASFSY